ncbi:DUF4159 domain-containing protein [Roseivirga misakiensis]|uniref:DUF4159 domain-containing protein n=1 Tax=Roseivirga misakiensis TaxID=1563681 RepID=UPI000A528AEC|nr:DUF4159 domain-containing protein [Roseivirga misakiensis]
MSYKNLLAIFLLFASLSAVGQSEKLKMAKLKYNGGGDWYANKTALPNLARFCNQYLRTSFDEEDAVVEVGSPELFDYSYIYMTGHGNVVFSSSEAENLRNYLVSGGFLHIDDNYGLDPYIRLEMKKVFPELEFIELPLDHPIYDQKFKFEKGLPKIHEHDNKPPQGFGLIYEGRLLCYYSYESDLGNGWEDKRIHNDTEAVRQNALRMGANIIAFALTQY